MSLLAGNGTHEATMPLTTCHPLYFKAAWHVSAGIAYFHVFLLVLFLLVRQARLSPLRILGGYLLNATIVVLLWLVLPATPFVCHVGLGPGSDYEHTHNSSVGITGHQHGTYRYTNALAFPVLDASLLAHLALEVWTRWRGLLQLRHRVAMVLTYALALGSLLWFHFAWQVAGSFLLGALVFVAWRLLLRVVTTRRSATPTNSMV